MYPGPYLSSGIQTGTFIVYHLSEYLREARKRHENEAGCRHTYALLSELQNSIIQKPKRRRIGGGIPAPRGSSWGGGGGRVASASIQIYAHRERGRERVRESERERESGRYCVHVCGCDTTCPIIYGELVATCISMQEPTLADGYLNHSNVTCNLAPTAMSIRIEKANASHTQRKRERLQPTPTPCMALRSRHGKTQDKRT